VYNAVFGECVPGYGIACYWCSFTSLVHFHLDCTHLCIFVCLDSFLISTIPSGFFRMRILFSSGVVVLLLFSDAAVYIPCCVERVVFSAPGLLCMDVSMSCQPECRT
jgi:hypothetical protein